MSGGSLPPRGRGAALLAALQKQREAEKAPGGPSAEQQAPSVPKGRAALLFKHREQQKRAVGLAPIASTSRVEQVAEGAMSKSDNDGATVKSVDVGATVKSVSEKVTDATSSLQQLSLPGKEPVTFRGNSGKVIRLATNYIKLFAEERGIFQYDVKFSPDIDAKPRRMRAVNQVMRELNTVKLFDGGSILYLPKQLTGTKESFTTHLPGPDGDQEITLTITYIKQKHFGDRECLTLFNVLFKRIMYILLYNPIGRNYFDLGHKALIPQHKLEVYPGYAISVSEEEDGVMICLDTQHRVLCTQNVYELLLEIRSADSSRFKELAHKNIIGSVVMTKYNNKTYTVHDISWEMSPQDTFPTRDGGCISFVEYYRQQYNLEIRDVDQPLLINRKNVKVAGSTQTEERLVCLVPELATLTSLTDTMRNDFKVMKDVAVFTRITPNQRIASLKKYMEKVKASQEAQKVLNDWGLKLANDLVQVEGRQLEKEQICFGGDQVIETTAGADWNRASTDQRLVGPVDLFYWIVFHTDRDRPNAITFAETMVRMGATMGCRINKPKMVRLTDDRNETYMNACKTHIEENTQVVVFICPTSRSDRYTIIKKICCTQIPIPSQVINSRTLCSKNARSIIQKIALQMTCKMGGVLWTVRFPFRNWMICGHDVYHGGPNKSVGGFVASINESVSKWFSMATFQEKEMGDYLKVTFMKALEAYKNEQGCFPAKIVLIRDGISDGQLEFCLRYEVEQIKSVIKEFCLDTKLCFIVVQKRINQRIFAMNREGYDNPAPGTVVDNTITRKFLSDFFLVPQNVRQGTVNPTHYIVLYDTCNLKPDQAQRLCYKLCHLYYNWPGTIRVPAPCQYAHKLAQLVGQHIKKAPSVELADKLFYL